MKLLYIKIIYYIFCFLLILITLITFSSCQSDCDRVRPPAFDQHTTWAHYGGGPDQSKYVVLDEINKSLLTSLMLPGSIQLSTITFITTIQFL